MLPYSYSGQQWRQSTSDFSEPPSSFRISQVPTQILSQLTAIPGCPLLEPFHHFLLPSSLSPHLPYETFSPYLHFVTSFCVITSLPSYASLLTHVHSVHLSSLPAICKTFARTATLSFYSSSALLSPFSFYSYLSFLLTTLIYSLLSRNIL